jgi:hypothetical protein
MNKLLIAISLVILATSANAFPTKVKLTQDPNFAMTEGTSVTLFTDKGKLEFGMKSHLYNSFDSAKKGQCFIFETESESTTEFNKKVDKSLAVSVTKTSCK